MSSGNSLCTDNIAEILRSVGVAHFAIAPLANIDDRAIERFDRWIESGMSAGMDYMSKYRPERSDPRLLLDGARTIVCCAIPYWHPDSQLTDRFAAYALADDYHEVVRRGLSSAAEKIVASTGGEWRVCVDTAPLRERYWAQRSKLGVRGLNGHLIIPGHGSYFFLGEILLTADIQRYAPCTATDCGHCGACVKACPTGAIRPDGVIDARKCLSYLTIEHRGDLPQGTDLHGHLYGCDECARACIHNQTPRPTSIDRFIPRPEVVNLTPQRAAELTQEEFSSIFRHSAVKRTKLAGLRRNALAIIKREKNKC